MVAVRPASFRTVLLAGIAACALSRRVPADPGLLPASNSRDAYRSDPSKFATVWEDLAGLGTAGSFEFCYGNRSSHPGMPMDVMPYSIWENGEKIIPGSLPHPIDYLADLAYPFDFENLFYANPALLLTRQMWWLSYAAAAIYLILVGAGQYWMKTRSAFDLKGPLAAWNLFLAAFSAWGALRMVPQLLLMLQQHGLEFAVCRQAVYTVGHGAAGLWMTLFVWSKYFELIDTAFLVLRKKGVGFLHWYHHCSVLMYTWHAYAWETPTGIFFAAMNYTVHAVMYSYYFLAAVSARPPKWGMIVTCMQISQMVVGVLVITFHLRSLTTREVQYCDGHLPNLTAGLAMYSSYFMLFLDFFVRRFCLKRQPPTQNPKKLD